MNRKHLSFVLAALLLATPALAAEAKKKNIPPQITSPAYVRVDNGWMGYWPHGGDYARFLLAGNQPRLKDAYHINLRPGLGMMLTFASKQDIGSGKDPLQAQKEWELAYWRTKVAVVKDKNRADLVGGRHDMRVTELTLPQEGGEALHVYMASVAGSEGVYVFSIAPVTGKDDAMVKQLLASVTVVHKKLDLMAESKRIKGENKHSKK